MSWTFVATVTTESFKTGLIIFMSISSVVIVMVVGVSVAYCIYRKRYENKYKKLLEQIVEQKDVVSDVQGW